MAYYRLQQGESGYLAGTSLDTYQLAYYWQLQDESGYLQDQSIHPSIFVMTNFRPQNFIALTFVI